MCNSLVVSQTFRLMKSSDLKSKKHLHFWMSDLLGNFWDGPGVHCITGNDYESGHFNLVAERLTNVNLLEDLDMSSWNGLTNKIIYQGFAMNFPKTKVERESNLDMSTVWSRIGFLRYDKAVQETSYLMVHNKLPVQERLFRIQLSRDPYCLSCTNAVEQDVSHFFISCERVQYLWNYIRELSYTLLGHRNVAEENLLKYLWPRSRKDSEICWLIGNYVFIVWDILYSRKSFSICKSEFFGFLKFKYREALAMNLVSSIAVLK